MEVCLCVTLGGHAVRNTLLPPICRLWNSDRVGYRRGIGRRTGDAFVWQAETGVASSCLPSMGGTAVEATSSARSPPALSRLRNLHPLPLPSPPAGRLLCHCLCQLRLPAGGGGCLRQRH